MMKRFVLTVVSLSLLLLCSAGQVWAFQVEMGGVTLDTDVEVKYSAGWRMKEQDDELISDVNSDDGNRSFDKGDMMTNKVSVMADIDLQYSDYGVFVRPRAFYDWAYDGTNANDSTTNNNSSVFGGSLDSSDEFSEETQDRHKETYEILDLYGYGTFDLGGRYLDLRVGRQVVSWGESVYLQNSISNAINPIDASASNAPGVALREIFLPVEQAYAQFDLTGNLSLSGYYQWKWEKTRLDEQGSYFSTSDTIDNAAERILIGGDLIDPLLGAAMTDLSIDKTADVEARDDGQWGAALRYLAEGLNDAEFGFYFANYHDKYPMIIEETGSGGTLSPTATALGAAPVVAGQPHPLWGVASGDSDPAGTGVGGWNNLPIAFGPGFYVPLGDPVNGFPAAGIGANMVDLSSYHLEYKEDIKLIGASFGTTLGATNVGGEVSYRMGIPIEVVDPTTILGWGYVEGDCIQVQLSAMHRWGLTPLWDSIFMTAEVGFNRVNGYGLNELTADREAWGGTVSFAADYLQVLQGLDMIASVKYKFNPDGTSSMMGSFVEHEDSIAYGLDFTYMVDYKFGVQFVDYLNGPKLNDRDDRDYLAVTAKYTF